MGDKVFEVKSTTGNTFLGARLRQEIDRLSGDEFKKEAGDRPANRQHGLQRLKDRRRRRR